MYIIKSVKHLHSKKEITSTPLKERKHQVTKKVELGGKCTSLWEDGDGAVMCVWGMGGEEEEGRGRLVEHAVVVVVVVIQLGKVVDLLLGAAGAFPGQGFHPRRQRGVHQVVFIVRRSRFGLLFQKVIKGFVQSRKWMDMRQRLQAARSVNSRHQEETYFAGNWLLLLRGAVVPILRTRVLPLPPSAFTYDWG